MRTQRFKNEKRGSGDPIYGNGANNEKEIWKLINELKKVPSKKGESYAIIKALYKMGKNGWSALLNYANKFHPKCRETLNFLTEYQFRKNIKFTNYLRHVSKQGNYIRRLNAKELLTFVDKSSGVKEKQFLTDKLIIELEVFKFSMGKDFPLKGSFIPGDFSYLSLRLSTDIDKILKDLYLNRNGQEIFSFYALEQIRDKIKKFNTRRDKVKTIFIKLLTFWTNSNLLNDQGLRRSIQSLAKEYLNLIYHYYGSWNYNPSYRSYTFKDKYYSFESSNGYENVVEVKIAQGMLIDMYLKLIRADKQMTQLIKTMEEDSADDGDKLFKPYLKKIKKDSIYIKKAIYLSGGQQSFTKGKFVELSKKNPKDLFNKIEDISKKLGPILLNLQNIGMIFNSYLMSKFYNNSWQFYDVYLQKKP